jgi:hypothetical protein
MAYDYTDAPEQRGNEPIPADSVATVQLTIRPGGAGEGGLLKRSQDGGCEMLDCELVVVDGPYMKRKLWERMIISGTTDGHAKAAEISRGKLRAILESARGIKPNDTSKEARARPAPQNSAISTACASSPRSGSRRAARKTTAAARATPTAAVITPDRKDWHTVEQVPRPAGPVAGDSAVVVPIAKPVWAS